MYGGKVLRPRLTPNEKEQAEKKRKLEMEATKKAEEIAQKKREMRPFIKFKGNIMYYTQMVDIAMVCDKLLDTVNKSKEALVIGFDLEWPFSFQTGSGKAAVIQISPDLENCYIFHVSKLKYLPKGLSEYLAHPNIRITGNNIKNDVRKLARDFTGLDVEKMLENCIDLGVMANSILPICQRWSLEKLVDYLLDLRINKSKKVRMSRWDVIPLSKEQQVYAAIDSYASLLLHNILAGKKKADENIPQKEGSENKDEILNYKNKSV